MILLAFAPFSALQMIAMLLPTRVHLTIYLWIIVVGKRGVIRRFHRNCKTSP